MYAQLLERLKDVARLQSVAALLDWDQQTYMPPGGVTARAEQAALVASLAHERLVADETRRLLETAVAPPDDFVAQTNLREAHRRYTRSAKIPNDLVKAMAHTQALAVRAWGEARAKSDFPAFAPLLEKTIELKRRAAEYIGYETEPYDALMDEFEPGARAADLETLFAELRVRTVALLDRIAASPHKPDPSILARSYPLAQQELLARRTAEELRFDFESGRADVSTHPFCTTIGGPSDVRMTTRYSESWLPMALYGTIHETGHSLYEQGLPKAHLFTPFCEAVSMGIHESQSLLWENMVGRGRPFVAGHLDGWKELFPASLADVTVDAFYRALNRVSPSFIRVESDELTYNLHIIVRFEIERALVRGELEVRDVPRVWNERFRSLLGITPPNDAEGCLQDIHWSVGAFGYFPTYTLGKLYAAQFLTQAERDIPELWSRIGAKDYAPLLEWLRERIHSQGRRYLAHELVQVVTGKPLSIEPFIAYATRKFCEIYGIN